MAKPEGNVNQSLFDGLTLLKQMMEHVNGFTGCTITDLQAWSGFDYQKVYRTLKTAQTLGFVESEDNKTWCIGKSLLYLSHRYLQSLEAEHKRIEKMVIEFSITSSSTV